MPSTMRAATVARNTRTNQPELFDSPLLLLAVAFSARRSKDRVLERVTRQKLTSLGLKIVFGDELPPPATPLTKGGHHG